MEKYGYLKKHKESWEWSLCKVDMRAIWSHFLGISVQNDTWTWLPRFFFIQSPVPFVSFMFGIVSPWFLRAVWLCSPSRFIGHGIWLVCSDLKLVKHVSGEDQCFALGRNCSDWTGSCLRMCTTGSGVGQGAGLLQGLKRGQQHSANLFCRVL